MASVEETDQAAVVAALETGAAVGEAHRPRHVQTHMSHVFLARDRVFKLKRSLRHAFADMSDLAARRAACEAEIEVNRALAPGLYLGVEPVTADMAGAIKVGGDGPPIDWVVVMRRFEDGATLAELASRQALTYAMVAEAIDGIVVFHRRQPPHRETGRPADYRRIVQGLRATEIAGAARLDLAPGGGELFGALDREILRLAPLIEARRKAGWVRRGHGDLHLRNLCVFEGHVTPFDALEFDPALATADVLYDIAFLLMDLRARGLDAHANLAMNRYWDLSGQAESGLALLPLFMATRAAVRMAVAVEAGDLVEAARYRTLGHALLNPAPPRLIAVGGLSGTGKSAVAAVLAPLAAGPCGARLLRTDVLRKTMVHTALENRLGERDYRPEARAGVYRVLAARARESLTAGAVTIADGTFIDPAARANIERAADGHPFVGLWLTAPENVRLARVAARRHDASDATVAVAAAQVESTDPGLRWLKIDATPPVADVIRRLGPLTGGSSTKADPTPNSPRLD